MTGKIKMTAQEQAGRAQEVAETSERVAKDVVDKVDSDDRPKAKPTKKGVPMAGKPKQPTRRPDSDPLQGATIDPEANYPKIVQLIVTAGSDDERSMEEFVQDARDALVSQANAKMATVLLQKVQVDGKHILHHHYQEEVERLSGKQD